MGLTGRNNGIAAQPLNGRLPSRTKLIYGVGDIGNALVNSAIQFFLMIFYTDTALIPAALASTALGIGKAWDAVNDPLFGWVSDRTTSARFGKRRVFMIFGALPLALSIALLWIVPPGLGRTGMFLWVALSFVFFDTMWTLTNVPYYALTAELTDDYDERSSLTAFRMIMAVPFYLVGAALTPVLAGMFAEQRAGYAAVGILYGAIAAAALLVCAAGIRERKRVTQSRTSTAPLRTLGQTFRNGPFVRLLIAYMVLTLSFSLIRTLMAYFLTYQLNMETQVPLVMGLMLVCVILAIFPWKIAADHWNKGPAYALGMAIGALAVAGTFLLPNRPTPWVYLLAALAGFGFAAQWVFPWSMVPDVVDHDRLKTGEQRSGMYYGVWGLATKTSEGLAIMSTGWILALFRYVPNIEQSSTTLLGIRLFFGLIPGVLIALALPLLIWYPITRETHHRLMAELDGSDE
jgi:glycoside/pentoside/hexuronide:cation symporter, GPH family